MPEPLLLQHPRAGRGHQQTGHHFLGGTNLKIGSDRGKKQRGEREGYARPTSIDTGRCRICGQAAAVEAVSARFALLPGGCFCCCASASGTAPVGVNKSHEREEADSRSDFCEIIFPSASSFFCPVCSSSSSSTPAR